MKTINKEIVTKSTQTVYVANDGTEFENAEECKKYEKSARGVLYAKYAPKLVKPSDEESLFGMGCCDNDVEIVRVETQEDADLILQILLLENSWYDTDERRKEVIDVINSAIGDFLLVGRGYDHDGFWLYGSRKSFIEKFNAKFEEL